MRAILYQTVDAEITPTTTLQRARDAGNRVGNESVNGPRRAQSKEKPFSEYSATQDLRYGLGYISIQKEHSMGCEARWHRESGSVPFRP